MYCLMAGDFRGEVCGLPFEVIVGASMRGRLVWIEIYMRVKILGELVKGSVK